MHDAIRTSSLAPEGMLGAMARAPVQFSLRDTPARDRDGLYREFFGRAVMRYEVEPSREVPFDIDVKLQMLPGLLMVSGKMHGSRNCRTRESMTDGLDDFAMALNLGGKYVVRQDDREIALAEGEATLFSLGKLCTLMHWPPGGLLAMRFPRAEIVRRVGDADRIFMRPIRAGTQALKLLASYVGMAQDRATVADFDLQQTFSSHVYDLIALSVGATREATDAAQTGGLRAARSTPSSRTSPAISRRRICPSPRWRSATTARHATSSGCSRRKARPSPTTCWSSALRVHIAC